MGVVQCEQAVNLMPCSCCGRSTIQGNPDRAVVGQVIAQGIEAAVAQAQVAARQQSLPQLAAHEDVVYGARIRCAAVTVAEGYLAAGPQEGRLFACTRQKLPE